MNSLKHQLEELETLKKEYDLRHVSQGESLIIKQFNDIKSKMDAKREKCVASEEEAQLIEAYYEKYMNMIRLEKRHLTQHLNQVKTNLDQDYKEIMADVDLLKKSKQAHSVDKNMLRNRILDLKEKLCNYVQHFSYLVEFRLSLNSEPSSVRKPLGRLEKHPTRFFFSADILKRVRKSKTRRVLVPQIDYLGNYKSVYPLANHSLLVHYDMDAFILYNSEGDQNGKFMILSQVKLVRIAYNQNYIFMLFQTDDSLTLFSLDYKLNQIGSRILDNSINQNQPPRMECFKSEVFILFNHPATIKQKEKAYYEVFDETLLTRKRISANFLINEDPLSSPSVIGASRNVLFVIMSSSPSSVRLVSRETGTEINRIENYLFAKCDQMFMTNESAPKLIGLNLSPIKLRKNNNEYKIVHKIYLFNSSNGSMLREAYFEFNKFAKRAGVSAEEKSIVFLPNGYFAFYSSKTKSVYFF